MAMPEDKLNLISTGVKLILKGLGEDPDREGLRDTPGRVARLYDDILDGRYIERQAMTAFVEDTAEGSVMVHHVPFYAFCEHHMLLFHGHFGMAYVPDKKILGLSKLVRIFRHGTKRLTIQERLTSEAVEHLVEQAVPKGAICYVTAEHTCMSLRGVKSPGAMTTTIAYRGVYEDDSELRQQFINEASK